MMRIIRCHPNRFDALVDFVAAHNPLPEHHIGYFGLTPEDVRQELRNFSLRFDRATHIAVEGGRIAGVFGADVDAETGRAWLFGPLVAAEPWAETADALYAVVAARLPATVREHQMFVDRRNVRAAAFAARHSFAAAGEWAIYYLPADRLDALPAAEAQPWEARYDDQLAALHARLFPSPPTPRPTSCASGPSTGPATGRSCWPRPRGARFTATSSAASRPRRARPMSISSASTRRAAARAWGGG